MARLSYQDHLAEGVIAEPLACDGCGIVTPAWALYEGLPGEPDGWICGACIMHVGRAAKAAEEAANALPVTSWDSDRGIYLKAERIRLLDTWRWTIAADSPLTLDCQAAFLAWLKLLNRMTLDSTPDAWVWPTIPEQVFE